MRMLVYVDTLLKWSSLSAKPFLLLSLGCSTGHEKGSILKYF